MLAKFVVIAAAGFVVAVAVDANYDAGSTCIQECYLPEDRATIHPSLPVELCAASLRPTYSNGQIIIVKRLFILEALVSSQTETNGSCMILSFRR